MKRLLLHDSHQALNAGFVELHGFEAVVGYGDPMEEYGLLNRGAGILDLSFRSRLCLLGGDRKKFLHGQVTNQVVELQVGQGCYAALVTAKGRMQCDLNIYCLQDELLLDLEPGLGTEVAERLRKYIIADDVEVVDVGEPYGLLSVQGPRATDVLRLMRNDASLPAGPFNFVKWDVSDVGEVYVMNLPRTGDQGFDLFVPGAGLETVWRTLVGKSRQAGGGPVGWNALELRRVEAGIPRFGMDIDPTNLPSEAGLESRAIHYGKGCYIGQEVIARLRTYGQVAKALRGIRFEPTAQVLPGKGDKVYWGDKEIGHVTSAIASPALRTNVALAYLRREHNQPGDQITVRVGDHTLPATVVTVPFQPFV